MFPPQGAPMGAGPAMPGMPPMGGGNVSPMGGMGSAPGQPMLAQEPQEPASLLSSLLGTMAPIHQQQRAQLNAEFDARVQNQIQNLVASMALPNPAGEAAMSGPAPVGMGVEPGLPEEEPMMGGAGY